jgi:hypothetical protein
MRQRQLAAPEIQAIVGGQWPCGRAEIELIDSTEDGSFALMFPRPLRFADGTPGVKVVDFTPERAYLLTRNARVAVAALCGLAEDHGDAAVCAFVARFGPLLNIADWLSQVHYVGWRPGASQVWPERFDTRFVGEWGSKDQHYGSDAFHFVLWCEERGFTEAAAYMRWLATLDRARFAREVLKEPVALYVWASEHLKLLRKELEIQRGDQRRGEQPRRLSEPLRKWLLSRSDETRLHFDGRPGRYVLRTTTLLSYLAAYTMLDVSRHVTEYLRQCEAGGCDNVIGDKGEQMRQRFCSDNCRWRTNKQAERLVARVRRDSTPLV